MITGVTMLNRIMSGWGFARSMACVMAASLGLVAGAAQAESKGTVHLAYVEWSSTVASTNVVRVVLEKAGYDVKTDRKSTRLNSSHVKISYAVFCLKNMSSYIGGRRI